MNVTPISIPPKANRSTEAAYSGSVRVAHKIKENPQTVDHNYIAVRLVSESSRVGDNVPGCPFATNKFVVVVVAAVKDHLFVIQLLLYIVWSINLEHEVHQKHGMANLIDNGTPKKYPDKRPQATFESI